MLDFKAKGYKLGAHAVFKGIFFPLWVFLLQSGAHAYDQKLEQGPGKCCGSHRAPTNAAVVVFGQQFLVSALALARKCTQNLLKSSVEA